MRRRGFLRGVAGLSGATLFAACSQPSPRPLARHVHIGAFSGESHKPDGSPPDVETDITAALREQGFINGQNMTIDWRHTEGDVTRYAEFAEEFVRIPVDILIASSASAARAALAATRTIPIVMAGAADALDYGLVNSYSHPGGNMTGTAFSNVEELTKRLEVLHEAAPAISRVVVLGIGATENPYDTMVAEVTRAANELRIGAVLPWVKSDADVAVELNAAQPGDALLVTGNTLMWKNAARVISVAAAKRMPAAYSRFSEVQAGGFMSYASKREEMRSGVGKYVRRIVDGAWPGDLPVQKPTIFELGLNLSVATALGISPPPSLVRRATVVP